MILIINDYAHVNGGASQVAISSALGLAERGHKVTFFAGVGPVDPRMEGSGIQVICLDQHDLMSDPQRLRAAGRGIWNRVARGEVEKLFNTLSTADTIVHVHLWYKALSASVVSAAVARRFRVVLTLHDYTAVCPNGSFYNYRTRQVCRLRPLGPECLVTSCDPRSLAQKGWRIVRNMVQSKLGHLPEGIDRFICVSDFSREILQPYLPVQAAISVIPNPISPERGDPVRAGENQMFLYVGRLTPQKGPELFAEAAKHLRVPAVFVGDGELRSEVLRINPRAEVTGWLNSEETLRYLAGARALVFPSRCFETQGLAVAEAAALGVPSIVPDTSAARDMVTDGKNGFWFTGGDLRSLTEKIQLLQDGEVAKEMGLTAHSEYWKNPMTLARHISALEKLYFEMARETSRN